MRRVKNKFSELCKGRNRFLLALFLLLTLSILVLSLLFFPLSMDKPYMGVTLSIKNGSWEVSAVDTNGLAIQAGIEAGDKPAEINGQPAPIFLERYEKHGTVYGLLITELEVINDDDNLISIALEDASQSWESLTELSTWFIVCIIFWVTSFYIFLKKPDNQAARLFCLCGVVFSLAISSQLAAERVIPTASWSAIISSIIAPWVLLHFFIVLPEERVRLRAAPLVYLIYLPAAVLLILYPLVGYADGQPLMGFRIVRLIEYHIGFIAVAIIAVLNYVRATSIRTRQQMKIVLIACLLALVPLMMILLISILGQHLIPSGFNIIFIAFIPLGIGYAIIKEKLLDIDLVIRRSLVYTLIIIVMAVILSSALFIGITFQESFDTPEQILLALALGILSTILFGPIKRGIEIVIDKAFYKDRYDYRQIIQNLSNALKLQNDTTSISRLIVGTSVNTLNLAGACLFVHTQQGSLELKASQGTFSDVDKLQKVQNLVRQPDNRIDFPDSMSGIDPDIAFLIPLFTAEKNVGVLCLSPKNTGQYFSSSDFYLIQGLASIAALTLHSALLVRDVSIRDTFVSIASHELRTPMSSIMGYTELLLKRNPPPEIREQWLKHIIDNSRFISKIIDDLLNVSRIQTGKIALKIEGMDVSSLITKRLEIIKEINDTHRFQLNIDSHLPKLAADHDKLGQIIGNLLDNAVKYSPDGGNIVISAYPDRKKDRIIISIADKGIGISPEDQDSLFTTFHRIQRPETQAIRGSGLGLYIVKEWTEAMDGEIWLESELDKGSTFYVAFPVFDDRTSV
ncbi:MAG: ATP-binding protein [Dehalococcoidia bacterium]|jgi:hypothetical protein